MLCAPFYYVSFADFWLADQLNSLLTVLLDAHYLVCFYIYNNNWYQTSGNLFVILFRGGLNYSKFEKLNLSFKVLFKF